MTESDSTPEHLENSGTSNDRPYDPPHSPTSPLKSRRPLRRAVIAAAVAAIAFGLLQGSATTTDHQNANFACMVVLLLGGFYILVQLNRVAKGFGYRFAVPAAIVLVAGLLFALFRFDGFSGEMLPQFKARFGTELERAELSRESTLSDQVDTSKPEAVAEADSPGFLVDGTGVIHERIFEVPSADSDLRILWTQGIGEGWSSFAVSGDRAVTLEQRDTEECITCYRLLTGDLLWKHAYPARHENTLGGIGPRATPSIHSGRVYAQGATGKVWCLNLDNGEVLWKIDLLELAGWDQLSSEAAMPWGRAGSLLMVDGMCVVPFGGPESKRDTGRALIALDADDGSVRWTTGTEQISYSTPSLMTLGKMAQIVSVNEATVTGHEIETGKQLWQFTWPGQSNAGANCASAILAGETRFLVGKGYGGGSALVKVSHEGDQWNADPVWQSASVLKTKFTHAMIDGSIAYGISNGSLEAIDLETSEMLWRQPRSARFGQGQILLVEDTIVAQSESGDLVFVAADPNEYRELLRVPAMDSKTWNIPTVAGKHILVRNDRQAVCYYLADGE